MANLTPIPISSLPVIDDPTGDELIPVSAQGSDGAVRLSDVGGGGIGDISALPAASTIASNDLAVISQGGTAKKVTAEQLKTFVKSGERGETVTLTVDRTGTLYSIPYSIVEPGDTHTRNCYKLTDTVLTDAELLSVVYMDAESNLYPLVEMTQTEFLSGSAYTDPGTWYAITGGSVKLATYTSGQGTTDQYSSAALRCNSTLLIVVPESGSGYTAGTYATEQFSRSAPSLTYTVGGSSSGGDLPDVTAADNGAVLQVVNGAWATGLKLWVGTQAQYDAIVTKDNGTLYIILEATT